jgi:hypothetical protein
MSTSMVGRDPAGDSAPAQGIPVDLGARERRGLERCRRALERERRVRGRPIASSDRHGLLLDLRGAVGHAPAAEVAARPPSGNLWRGGDSQWEGWVVAVHGDLVHLTARRPGDEGEAPIRAAEVLSTARSGAVVRLDDGTIGVVPWDELSWEPTLGLPELPRGMRLEGRIVALSLEGPVLSPRAVAPTPWPAIALAYPPGSAAQVRVEGRAGGHVLVRTERAPRAAAIVPEDEVPDATSLDATVVEVNAVAAALVLENFSPRSPRALRPAPGAPTQGPPGPQQVA